MTKKIAVAMSVYGKDKVEYLERSIESVYQQVNVDFDIFLQIDGPISESLSDVVYKYSNRANFFLEHSENNLGLAAQLNRAINKIISLGQYSYIARMDADDICMPNRFEKQLEFLSSCPEVAVVGTAIIEFDDEGGEFIKKMPTGHTELSKGMVKKCPFNHPTVVFNLNVIKHTDLKYDGRLKNTQDYYLWVDLLKKGYKFANLDTPLLRFRVDENFHERRGLYKAVNDFKSRVYAMRELKAFTLSNIIHTLLLFGLRLSPVVLKKYAYKNFR